MEIADRLYRELVVAGKDLLQRQFVAHPREIDIAMIGGTGFPLDKGGPMKWSDLTGLSLRPLGGSFY